MVEATARTVETATLTIRHAREGDDHRIDLAGELDIAGSEVVEAEFAHAEAGGPGRIVVDLGGLEFMDSTGVRLLLALNARVRRDDGTRLALRRGPPAVQQVLRITGVDALLPFVD
jgi:anti-sigma B factor antagonist